MKLRTLVQKTSQGQSSTTREDRLIDQPVL